MTRMFAFVAALLMSSVAVSSACVASSWDSLRFTIEPTGKPDQVQLRFKRDAARGHDSWSSTFRTSDLAGLDATALRGSSVRPLRFTIARDAGRVDCAGNGGGSMANGTCSVTPDRAFNDFLAANGIAQPSAEQTYGLIAIGVKRELVTAIRAANYPTPTPSKLMELSAVGVTPSYIRDLAARGYRPNSLQNLVEFAALGITPEYIESFARAGYGSLKPNELVQLKAMNITPDYIASFERLGYRDLPVHTLVQLKALNVTPEFVRAVQRGDELPSPDRLVQIRAVSRDLRK